MDKFETTSILAVLKAAYPKFYQGLSLEEANSIVNLWAEMFADNPAEIVATAVKAMIATAISHRILAKSRSRFESLPRRTA